MPSGLATDVVSGSNRLVRATRDNIFELLTAAMAIPIAYGKVVPVGAGSTQPTGGERSEPPASAR